MLWPLETPLLGFAELPPLNVRGLGVPQSHQQPPQTITISTFLIFSITEELEV